MDCIATRIPYRQTNAFTDIILDYLDQDERTRPFFEFPPNLSGIKKAIEARKKISTGRKILVEVLRKQYGSAELHAEVKKSLDAFGSENCFTITTAHQPNLFTGPLYFIYKILHVIKLSHHLNESLPGNHFVPVFYMGSEDADLEELGNFYIDGEKFTWNTNQSGAVGRMRVDKELIKLIGLIEGQLSILPSGKEILNLVSKYYKEGALIQDATFQLVNTLFGKYGLVVLIPDSAELKQQASKIFQDDLLMQTASQIVERTIKKMQDAGYKAQAQPREINLFYLEEGIRERIVQENTRYKVPAPAKATAGKQGTSHSFTKDELLKELEEHPERFSPNVILRGVYQELILPNIVFIGGGGELAYWLQNKELFQHYKLTLPVLLLRNSFLIVEKKWREKISKLGLSIEDFFQPVEKIMGKIVEKESKNKVKLNGVFEQTEQFYEQLKKQSQAIDVSLVQHVEALKTRSIHNLRELEKKMLRAEKRKFSDQQRQVQQIKDKLFPKNGLQERIDNFIPYYAKWGEDFIDKLYQHSLNLEQEFVILEEA